MLNENRRTRIVQSLSRCLGSLTCSSDSWTCYWYWGLPVGSPLLQGPCSVSVFRSPCLPPSSHRLVFWAGCLQFHSCLLWRWHTSRDEFRILHACMSACLPASACARVRLCACALVWGRSTCSVVSMEERAELATPYVQAEVTAQAQWIPLRSECVVLHFEHLEIGGRGGVNSNQHYTHSVSTQP